MEVLEKTKVEVVYDPPIVLLGVFLKKSNRDSCLLMVFVALFTIAKSWKHTRY
jgi:hypothetical protein